MRSLASSSAAMTSAETASRAAAGIGIATRSFDPSKCGSSKRRARSITAASPSARTSAMVCATSATTSSGALQRVSRKPASATGSEAATTSIANALPRVERAFTNALRRENSFELAAHSAVGGDGPRYPLRAAANVHDDGNFTRPIVDQPRQPVDLIARRYVDVPAAHAVGRCADRRRHERRYFVGGDRDFDIRLVAGRGTGTFAHAQPSLDDEHGVVLEEMLRLRIDLRKDDHVAGTRRVLQLCDENLLVRLGQRAARAGDSSRHGNGGILGQFANVLDRRCAGPG